MICVICMIVNIEMQLMTVGCGAGTKPVRKPASKTKAAAAAAAEESNSDDEEVQKAEPTQWQLAKAKAAAEKAAEKKDSDSDSDEEDVENTVPKKQSVAKAKPAAKPTRGDFILHFVTLAQCNLLGGFSCSSQGSSTESSAEGL